MAGVILNASKTKQKKIIAICILIVLPGGNLHGQIIIIKQKIVKSFVLYSVLCFWCAYHLFFNFAIPHPSDYLNSFIFSVFRASSALPINFKWSFKSNRKVSFADFSIKINLFAEFSIHGREREIIYTLSGTGIINFKFTYTLWNINEKIIGLSKLFLLLFILALRGSFIFLLFSI